MKRRKRLNKQNKNKNVCSVDKSMV